MFANKYWSIFLCQMEILVPSLRSVTTKCPGCAIIPVTHSNFRRPVMCHHDTPIDWASTVVGKLSRTACLWFLLSQHKIEIWGHKKTTQSTILRWNYSASRRAVKLPQNIAFKKNILTLEKSCVEQDLLLILRGSENYMYKALLVV